MAAQPLHLLLSPERMFMWTLDHEESCRQVKKVPLSSPVIAPFNPALPTILQTDASRLCGLGYDLLQKHGGGQHRLVKCGSRFLIDAETWYAVIEVEMVAVVWVMAKCRFYLVAFQHFTLLTKPTTLSSQFSTHGCSGKHPP